MGVKVAKFGGSSLADAAQIEKAVAIIEADPARRYVVVSAPGKRSPSDIKVTDLLYALHEQRYGKHAGALDAVKQRYDSIIADLGMDIDLSPEFDEIDQKLVSADGSDYAASRGEYLNACLIAARLGWPVVDAAEVVRFSPEGELLADETETRLARVLGKLEHAIIPGFYGATSSGQIRTFSRGGSDVTGAWVARALSAEVYENWTDVSGILVADPRIVDSPQTIRRISYTALRELTYMGASVLHEDAINPVRERWIPINIRNTNVPTDPGTWIEATPPTGSNDPAIIGLAGKRGYTALTIRKAQTSGAVGATAKLLGLFAEAGVVLDVVVTGVDSWMVAAPTDKLEPVFNTLMDRIGAVLHPVTVTVREHLAIIGIVESGALPLSAVASRLAHCLAEAGIELALQDSGVGDMHIVAIDEQRYEEAIRTIYAALAD